MPICGAVIEHTADTYFRRARATHKSLQVHRIGEDAIGAEGKVGNALDANCLVGAQIAGYHRWSSEAQAAEQDRIGIIFEDMTATVEDIDITLERLKIARIDGAGGIVDGVYIAALARRPFEPD